MALLTFIAKDQPPRPRTAKEKAGWLNGLFFFFLLQQKQVVMDCVTTAMEESALEKSKDQKLQPLLFHGISSACMLCHHIRPGHEDRGRDNKFKN